MGLTSLPLSRRKTYVACAVAALVRLLAVRADAGHACVAVVDKWFGLQDRALGECWFRRLGLGRTVTETGLTLMCIAGAAIGHAQ